MVDLTFYGGVREIGGNKVLLEDNGTRVFLDFGQSFTFGEEYFTSWLVPRAINGLLASLIYSQKSKECTPKNT